jgi:hypothetical protein
MSKKGFAQAISEVSIVAELVVDALLFPRVVGCWSWFPSWMLWRLKTVLRTALAESYATGSLSMRMPEAHKICHDEEGNAHPNTIPASLLVRLT